MSEAASESLREARRRERISQAAWRAHRAEVARLIAAGEEAAAQKLLQQAGVEARPGKFLTEPSAPRDDVRSEGPATKAIRRPPAAKEAIAQSGSPPRRQPVRSQKSEAKTTPQEDQKPPAIKALPKPRARRSTKRTWGVWLRERPPWVVSLATHAALIALFGMLSFATIGDPTLSLTATLGTDETPLETAVEVTLADLAVELETPVAEAEPLELPPAIDLASLIEPASFSTETPAFSAISGAALMAEVAPSGGSAEGESAGGSPSAGGQAKPAASGRVSFFGSETVAQRVVFVVDNSGSMQHGRMETTLLELQKAVEGLSYSQEFYVVFFSDQAYPMFFPEPATEPLPATYQNKRRLVAWLHTVEMCLGGRLLDAMEIAKGLQPDVVYLLTDGDIRSERVAAQMTAKDAWGFPIHTLGMGARTRIHAEILLAIASQSGGEFRPVGANPQAVARSRSHPLPYHRTTGEVWGSAVVAWD